MKVVAILWSVCVAMFVAPSSFAGPVDVGLEGDGAHEIIEQVIGQCEGNAWLPEIVPILGYEETGIRSGYVSSLANVDYYGVFLAIGYNPNDDGQYLYWMSGRAPALDCFDPGAPPPYSHAPTLATCQMLHAVEHVAGNEYAECKFYGHVDWVTDP